MTYLSSPYFHPFASIRQARFEKVCRIAGKLMRDGEHIYCPIAHSHSIQQLFDLPHDHEFWMRIDEEHLKRCDKLVVAMMDGWEESVGVAWEIKRARELGLPVEFMEVPA